MKKGKILKTLAIAGTCLCAPLLFSGCSNENKTDPQNFRVQDGWVQFTQDGETWKNLIKAEEEIKTYTITYDYGEAKHLFGFGSEPPATSTIEENAWLNNELPGTSGNAFKGWFIKGTNKQITEYDYIAGNITLEARFEFTADSAPSGLYNGVGKYIKTWEQLLVDGDIVVQGDIITYGFVQGDLKIDRSIASIGEKAFYNNPFLSGVTIPDGVSIIGKEAFELCRSLNTIIIPEDVLIIEKNAFSRCDNLTSVKLMEPGFTEVTWQVYDHNKNILSYDAAVLTDRQLVSYLKHGYELKQVTKLHESSDWVILYDTHILVSVLDKTIEDMYVSSLGSNSDIIAIIDIRAFANCKNLTNVTISDEVMEIGVQAFVNCDALTTITFEEKDGYKWQVYENDAWRDAEANELFDLAKSGKQLKRVSE